MIIVFRCDAGLDTGLGHMMRSLALAQFAKDESCEVAFFSCSIPENMKKRLKAEGIKTVLIDSEKGSIDDAEKTSKAASEEKADWIVTDGYHFGSEYQKALKDSGHKLLCIDDLAGSEYSADIVLNQSPGFEEKDFKNPQTKLLLGLKYFLLRREFRKASRLKRRVAGKKKVLVTMGGTDPEDLTGRVIKALSSLEFKKMTVLVSSMNPNIEKLEGMLSCADYPIEIVMDAKNVIGYMQDSDIAVHSAGVTSWELAYLGIPSVSYILAKNQEPNAKELGRSCFSNNLGWADNFSADALKKVMKELLKDNSKLKQMSEAGKQLIDGLGPDRVFSAMSGDTAIVSMKIAVPADMEDYLKWRNTPEVYRYFFSPNPVLSEEHQKWFEKKLSDKGTFLYTAFVSEEKIGCIRFEDNGTCIKTSVMLDPSKMGRGLGPKVIKKGVERFITEWNKAKEIVAEIKEENGASIKAFEKAGFEKTEPADREGSIKMIFREK